MKDLKYPMAYAPLLLSKYQSEEGIGCTKKKEYCYVTAPCYIVAETIKYNSNGETSKVYEVVFAKGIDSVGVDYVRHYVPGFNTSGECINSTIVHDINTDYDIVNRLVNGKNGVILGKMLSSCSMAQAKDIISKFKEDVMRSEEIINMEEHRLVLK